MPTVLQFRRGTTSQNNSHTGSAGEISIDTTLDTIRVHDGSTAGGFEITSNAATQTLTNKTLTSAVLNTGVSGTAVLDEDNMASNSATQIATQQSIKAYVDTEIGNLSSTLTISDDSSTSDTVTVGTDTLNFAGGTGLTSTVTDNTVTFAIDSTVVTESSTDTLTNKTIDAANNTLSNIGNSSLTNSSITVTDGSTSTATSLGGTITFSGTANEIEVGESSGTLTFGLPDNVTVGGALTVTGNLTVNGTTTTVNSTNTTLDDNLLELNSGAASNANDSGIIIERGSTGDNAIIAWDESADKFVVGTTTATASDTGDLTISTGTLVANIEATTATLGGSDIISTDNTKTLTNKTIDAASNTLSNIGNSSLTNSSITINGSGVSLGGSVDISGGTSWQAVKTSAFTAVAGEGYFVNTTSAAITVTLPASPTQGDEVSIIDYAGTADSNNITVGRNSENIQGSAADLTVSVERAAFTLVYADSTQGWLLKDK